MHDSRRPAAHALIVAIFAVACTDDTGTPGVDAGSTGVPDGGEADGGAADGSIVTSLAPWRVVPFPEIVVPEDNPSSEEKTALGRLLFYDPIVSSDHQVACGTCHSEAWGMGDALAVSVGQGGGLIAGPGRTGPHRTTRNAPSLFNVAFRPSMFWDGHAATLEEQVKFPFASDDEFARPFADVVTDLRALPKYVALFAAAFPDEAEPVSETTFARAVASFERTILSRQSLYDAYVSGDTLAMNDAMVQGMRLFDEELCSACHVPPLFAGDRFANRHAPPVPGLTDDGRYDVTSKEADRGAFSIPSLRNAHDGAPYFHSGAVATLAEAVAHEVDEAVAHDGARALSDTELSALVAFIEKGLVDGRHAPTRPQEVPSGFPVPIDGSAIRR